MLLNHSMIQIFKKCPSNLKKVIKIKKILEEEKESDQFFREVKREKEIELEL